MAYSDNYPNGYKSGYSSADDPDRRDYSPMGVEGARRDAMAASYERDSRMADYYAGVEREEQRRQRVREQHERERAQEERDRKDRAERSEKRIEVIKYLTAQMRENYKNMGFFKKAVATLSGKGYWKETNKFWDRAVAQVDEMSDKELDNFHRTHIR